MLVVNKLCMAFAGRPVLKDLSFTLERGSVVGFLGANGAGKTTTMRLISGFLQPVSGSVSVCGYELGKQRRQAQACIGYLPEAPGGFAQLTAAEFLRFCAQARGLSADATAAAIQKLCRSLELRPALTTPLRKLSKGWRQRVWLAQALLHDPALLILDEPTDGLDPNQKKQVHALIRQMAPSKTLLFSTHNLEEAATLCDRVIIIADGRKVADDAVTSAANLTETFYRLTAVSVPG